MRRASALILLLSACSGEAPVPPAEVRLEVQETLLGMGTARHVSPDGRRAAWVDESGGRVFVDGKTDGEVWDDVNKTAGRFSPDSSRFVYSAMRGQRTAVVVDGVAGPLFAETRHRSMSPDSKRVLYVAKDGRGERVIVDGVDGPVYDEITQRPRFSSDSKRVGYAARRGEEILAVTDGVEGPPFGKIVYHEFFSPDGSRTAYWARTREAWRAVVDGVEGSPYVRTAAFASFRWSPDGRHVAYSAVRDGRNVIIRDGVEVDHEEGCGPPFWSPDGSKLAYARGGSIVGLSVNGEFDGHEWDRIRHIEFSPGGRITYLGRYLDRERIVFDGAAGPEFIEVEMRSIRLKPDESGVLYHGTVAEGQRIPGGPLHEEVRGVTISPDSKRIAYQARDDGRWRVIVDGRPEDRFEDLEPRSLVFGPDSKHCAYYAKRDGAWIVVVDRAEGPHYDSFQTDGRFPSPVFEKLDRLVGIGTRDGKIYRFEITIRPRP